MRANKETINKGAYIIRHLRERERERERKKRNEPTPIDVLCKNNANIKPYLPDVA
ncbi:MAG: hypothetical protein HPY50_05170 [Firmicutes bacterium]|nr:hypothetical protein [Bacillota bacterium]